MTRNEVLDANISEEDESGLRPSSFDEYVGQTSLKENLKVLSVLQNYVMNHWIMYFYMDLWFRKTTMSMIIANEMGTNIKITTGPSIEKLVI